MVMQKLQEEAEEQRQRMEQASKALNFCVSQDEFEGSSERVSFRFRFCAVYVLLLYHGGAF